MKCELLSPAGSMDKLITAVHYGADAIYLGGKEFSLRARAGNFTQDEIVKAVKFAHRHGVRIYVTVNIFARNKDLVQIAEHLEFLKNAGVDALIISDPGILRLAWQHAQGVPIHLSTQANTLNISSVLFWQEMGVKRINIARELCIEEIREIKKASNIEIEVFVHGALCISYSGRCMLSLYLTGRDANQGNCAHPCRYSYRLEEAKRPGEYFPVEEDQRGVYIFNSKDLCLADRLPEIISAGVDSIKIEGRMKGIYYVAGVTRAYRTALDLASEPDCHNRDEIKSKITKELATLGSRGYTENFFNKTPSTEDMLYSGPEIDQTWIPAAMIESTEGINKAMIKVMSIIRIGDELEYMHKTLTQTRLKVTGIQNMDGKQVDQAQGGMKIVLTVENIDRNKTVKWSSGGLLRRKPPERTNIT